MVITSSRSRNGNIPPPVKGFLEHRLCHHQDYVTDYKQARQELQNNNGNGTTAGDVVFWGAMVRAVSMGIESNVVWFSKASKGGYRAIRLLEKEIPNYKQEVEKERSLHEEKKGKEANMGKHGGDRKSEEGGNQGVQYTLKRGYANKDYLLARLARDRPDILEDYGNGKYKSAGLFRELYTLHYQQKLSGSVGSNMGILW